MGLGPRDGIEAPLYWHDDATSSRSAAARDRLGGARRPRQLL